jgi:hypothetical protein
MAIILYESWCCQRRSVLGQQTSRAHRHAVATVTSACDVCLGHYWFLDTWQVHPADAHVQVIAGEVISRVSVARPEPHQNPQPGRSLALCRVATRLSMSN